MLHLSVRERNPVRLRKLKTLPMLALSLLVYFYLHSLSNLRGLFLFPICIYNFLNFYRFESTPHPFPVLLIISWKRQISSLTTRRACNFIKYLLNYSYWILRWETTEKKSFKYKNWLHYEYPTLVGHMNCSWNLSCSPCGEHRSTLFSILDLQLDSDIHT